MSSRAVPSGWLTAALIVGIILLLQADHSDETRGVIATLLGVIVALLYRTRFRLRELERQVDILSKRLETASPEAVKMPAPSMPATVTIAPAALQTLTASTAESPRIPPSPATATAGAVAAPVTAPSRLPPIASKPLSAPAMDRAVGAFGAWLRSGNPLARAGVVILFFGGSFLAKYAADHSMLPIELRMAALALGTLALLTVGWRLRGSRPLYAQTLQGGGVAGFYLTVFASTRLYQLLPHGLALALMIVVALAAAMLAVAQNALALAVIGTGGGFLAPLLLAASGGSLAALFTYYAVLNLGVFTVAWFRAWRVLNWVGFIFTFGIAGLFRSRAYAADQQLTMEFFLWLFFLLYFAVSVLFSIRQKPELRGYVSASLVFGLPLAVFGLHASVIGHQGFALAWSALGLAVFYIVAAYVLLKSAIANLRLLSEAFAALGVIFATLAVPLAFDRQSTAIAWAVEGAGLVWLGMRQQRALASWFGLALQLIAGVAYLADHHTRSDTWPVLNGPCSGAIALALAGLLSGWWLQRSRLDSTGGIDILAALWAVTWWLGGGLAEIARYAPGYDTAAQLALGAFTALVLNAASQRMRWDPPWRIAVGLLPLTAAGGLAAAFEHAHPFAEWAWAGWLPLLATSYRLLYRWPQDRPDGTGVFASWLHAATLWLLLLLAAWEGSWQTHSTVAGVWPAMPWILAPALALLWLSRQRLQPDWPCARHEPTYRMLAAPPLAIACTLWVAAMSLGSDGDPVALLYIPLLNPLDLGVLLASLALARYWHSLGEKRRSKLTPDDPRLLPGLAAALLFVWLNSALVRALHYLAGTPLNFDDIMQSILVQASLSILWALLGFSTIVVAARRERRDAWFVGAGLMALLVAKLFVVDTAGRGTMARIASFLIAGVLLLLAGYVSPLPPRRQLSSPESGA